MARTVIGKRPARTQVLKHAREAVRESAESRRGYDRQTVEHEILNHFDGLTNSDDDYEFIVDAIREAEGEYNDAHDCEL